MLLNAPVILVTPVFFASRIRPDFAEQRAAQGQSSTRDYGEAMHRRCQASPPIHASAYALDQLRR